MTALWMHARAQWRARRGSLILLAVLIALGTAVSLTAFAGARRSASVVDRFMAEERTVDVIVHVGDDPPPALLRKIAQLPEVEDASVVAPTLASPENSGRSYYPLLQSTDGKAGFTLQRGVLVSGRQADPDAADEVVLSEAHARGLGKQVGDTLVLLGFTPEEQQRCLFADDYDPSCDAVFAAPGGRRVPLRVVGVARTGSDLRNRTNEISLSFLTPAFYEQYGAELAAPELMLLTRLHDPSRVDAFSAAVQAALPEGTEATFEGQNVSPVEDSVGVLTVGLVLFGLVAALAAAVAVGQAVVRQAAASGGERRLLRALGLSSVQQSAGALLAVAPAVATGVLLGVAGAWFASKWMPIGLARRVEVSPGHQLDVRVLGGGALVVFVGVVVFVVGAAWLVDRRARAPRRRKGSWMPYTPVGRDAARSVGLRHALGTGNAAVSSRMAIVAIASATAGVIAVVTFGAGLDHLVTTPALYGWGWDAMGIDDQYRDAVLADPDVDAVAELRAQLSLRVNGVPTYGFAVRPVRGDITPAIVEGREPRAPDEVALGRDTMARAGAKLGDEVRVAGSSGELTLRVTGQAVIPTDDDGYPLAEGAIVYPDVAEQLGLSDSLQVLGVRVREGSGDAVYERISSFGDDGGVIDRPSPPAEIEKLEQVRRLPQVLAAFMVLLGLIAIAHAIVVSVRRGRHDLGVLRALGFRGRDVGATVAWQAVALAVAGGAIGLPLGVLLGRFVWRSVAEGTGVRTVYELPVLAVLLVIPAAALIAVLAALVPARRAARLHPSELLRAE